VTDRQNNPKTSIRYRFLKQHTETYAFRRCRLPKAYDFDEAEIRTKPCHYGGLSSLLAQSGASCQSIHNRMPSIEYHTLSLASGVTNMPDILPPISNVLRRSGLAGSPHGTSTDPPIGFFDAVCTQINALCRLHAEADWKRL